MFRVVVTTAAGKGKPAATAVKGSIRRGGLITQKQLTVKNNRNVLQKAGTMYSQQKHEQSQHSKAPSRKINHVSPKIYFHSAPPTGLEHFHWRNAFVASTLKLSAVAFLESEGHIPPDLHPVLLYLGTAPKLKGFSSSQ